MSLPTTDLLIQHFRQAIQSEGASIGSAIHLTKDTAERLLVELDRLRAIEKERDKLKAYLSAWVGGENMADEFDRLRNQLQSLRASIGAIHHTASNPSLDKTVLLCGQFPAIVAECEHCIPELKNLPEWHQKGEPK